MKIKPEPQKNQGISTRLTRSRARAINGPAKVTKQPQERRGTVRVVASLESTSSPSAISIRGIKQEEAIATKI